MNRNVDMITSILKPVSLLILEDELGPEIYAK